MGWLQTLKKRARRSVFPTRFWADLESMRLTQGRLLCELNRGKPVQPLHDCEFRVFSQWGEDGIIQRLITSLPIAHRTFIEFGVEDFSEANCRFLLMNNNWRGYVIDGSEKRIASLKASDWWWKHDIRAHSAFITRDNVDALLRDSGFDKDLGILSVDVDGVDYWLLQAITSFNPRIIIAEYNSLFGDERAITVPYDERFTRRAAHYSDLYFGASLGALTHFADSRGYSLVGTESAGVNAFFVRNDLLGDVKALSVREGFTESMVRQSRDREGKLDYLNYDQRLALIRGLPVVNVVTGDVEPF